MLPPLTEASMEFMGYIPLSDHFRQLQQKRDETMVAITSSSSWETDSGLGESPPPTPGYARLPHQQAGFCLHTEDARMWDDDGLQPSSDSLLNSTGTNK